MAVSARHSRTPAVCGPGSPWGLPAGSLCGSLEPLPSVFGVVALPQRWQDQEEWELVILGVNAVAGLSRGTVVWLKLSEHSKVHAPQLLLCVSIP